LTDRHFAHHPWELDTVETTCGLCDVGCTLNIEHTRGIVRRTTHLWERGVNLGYTCELGRWGHEHVQDPTRLRYAQIREADGYLEVELDEALDLVAERLRHYQGSQFAALGSPDNTNEDSYVLQQFTRAVMGSNNIDRLINPRLGAIEQASLASFGTLANTAGMQEAMTSSNAVLVVGPDPGTVSPVASYWLYWAHRYRETTFIVLHDQEYFLAGRSNNWINVAPEHQADVVKAIGKLIVNEGLAKADPASWFELERIDPAEVASRAGVPLDTLTKAAMLYATGGKGVREGTSEYAASAIWHSLVDEERVDVQPIALALHNLALLCGNVGRPGGGVLALRMLTNYQGSTDVGCHPAFLTGTRAVSDPEVRGQAEQLWSSRWNEGAVAQNGFKQLRSLPAEVGVGHDGLIEAIERGQIKAMYIAAQSHEFGEVNKRYMHYGRMRFDRTISPELLAALAKLEFLAVEDCFESDLTRIAHVVLPTAMFLEKDGSFTNFDRTVQRVRFAVSPPGDAKPSREHIGAIAERLGYSIPADDPDRILSEIASLTPEYAGISFPRLERGGMQWPVRRFGTEQTVFLSVGNGLVPDEIRFVAD
jgi:predicted molibdopterin-dependent oxidoreductase YjgC